LKLTDSWVFYVTWCNSSQWTGPPHSGGFTIIHRHTTVGRTPLDEWLVRRR